MIFDLAIIGGGPAGTAAAITAARSNLRVLLLEGGRFPRHKVCGEFVSPEGVTLLADLGLRRLLTAAPRIAAVRIFAGGLTAQFPLYSAAAAISRYDLDNMLWERALTAGTDCRLQTKARSISGRGPFAIETSGQLFTARSVINASGRWSNLRRSTLSQRTTAGWIGFKAHFSEPSSAESVDLYFFAGGYCGVQPLGDGRVNACAMVRSNLATSIQDVLRLDDALDQRSREWKQLSAGLATSPLIFAPPEAEEAGVLFAGDAAGFIDPFVGDGISMALRSGMMAATSLVDALGSEKTVADAAAAYRSQYARELRPLFRNSGWLRRLTSLPETLHRPVMAALRRPGITQFLVSKTRLQTFDPRMGR